MTNEIDVQYRTADSSVYNDAVQMGASPIQATILANRLTRPLNDFLSRYSDGLPSPFSMGDVDKAANRIARAIQNQEKIWILSDFDNDGIGGMAVAKHIFIDVFKHPAALMDNQITHRDTDGYGLTMGAISKMEARYESKEKPDLLITIDIGSSNGAEASYLKEHYPEMDVIVTDHHHVPEKGYPDGICAFVNPNKPGDPFEDGTICGASVIFFVLEAARSILEKNMFFGQNTISVWSAIPFLASATIADCVSMESPLNRYLVQHGLSYINQSQEPNWRALKAEFAPSSEQVITEETMGWKLGPMINSNSRMGMDGQVPLSFFLAKDNLTAETSLTKMMEVNASRKDVQNEILDEALAQAEAQDELNAIIVHLEKGVAGVGGIVASRIKEKFGKPTIVLTTIGDNKSTGSARSVDGLSVLDALKETDKRLPELFLKFGGHHAAAGMTVRNEWIIDFRRTLSEVIDEMTGGQELVPSFKVDARLLGKDINMNLINEIEALGPYGQKFESPLFEVKGEVSLWEPLSKKTHVHVKLHIQLQDGLVMPFTWFNALKSDEYEPLFFPGQPVKAVVSLSKNVFRGKASMQALIHGVMAL